MENTYHSVFVNKANKFVEVFSDKTEMFNVFPETSLLMLEVIAGKSTLQS